MWSLHVLPAGVKVQDRVHNLKCNLFILNETTVRFISFAALACSHFSVLVSTTGTGWSLGGAAGEGAEAAGSCRWDETLL